MITYTVTVTRGNDLWIAETVTAAGDRVGNALDFDSFADLHETMPEFIADMTDTGPGEFTVEYRYIFGGRDVTDQIRRLLETSAGLRRLQAEADDARQEALGVLAEIGLSQRTMADVADLSHQRVQQLLKAS